MFEIHHEERDQMQDHYRYAVSYRAKSLTAVLLALATIATLSVGHATASELSNDSATANPAGRLVFSVTANVDNYLTVTRDAGIFNRVSFHDANSEIVNNTSGGLVCTRSDGNHTITCYSARGLLSPVTHADLAINTGAGDDIVDITGGSSGDAVETDTIDLGSGSDTLVSGSGSQVVSGGSGDDSVSTGIGNDTIDMVDGTADSMTYCGSGGSDVIDIDVAGGDGNSGCETRNLR